MDEEEGQGGAKHGPSATHRAGFAALLGPPNAGKSTLLNRVLGEKLAIVTAKPQTTRSKILGIHPLPDAQLLLLDTPGLHESERLLNRSLNEAVDDAVEDCDLGLVLVDLTRGWEPMHQRLVDGLRARGRAILIVGTKCDLAAAQKKKWPLPEAKGLTCVKVSARTGEGVKALLTRAAGLLPLSPPLYPDDVLTDRPVRWLAGELVREAAMEALGDELPYSLAVDVIDFDEKDPAIVRIRANLLVERDSQKRIVVGRGGEVVKAIGIQARKGIERLLDQRVYLELFVKIDPRWLKNERRIEALGYGGESARRKGAARKGPRRRSRKGSARKKD